MSRVQLRDWAQGDRNSAAHLNEAVTILKTLCRVLGWDWSKLTDEDIRRISGIVRVGVVTTAGPNGEADFPDERYWVYECHLYSDTIDALSSVPILLQAIEDNPIEPFDGVNATISAISCVHNLSELLDHSHSLREGQALIFFALSDLRPTNTDGTPSNSGVRHITMTGVLPPIQYQYMVLQAVANGKIGADNIRAHPLYPTSP